MQINSYLTFSGNCREAMTFYQECLGGELNFQTIGESPLADQMPPQMKECILHSTLTTEDFVIMGSDMTPETGLVKGNAVSLMLNCSNETDIRMSFDKLSDGGTVKHQLENAFWGALFGNLTDKYGNNWILNSDKNTNNYGKKQLHKKISEEFANGNIAFVSHYLADNVKWNILGNLPIIGKEEVIEVSKMSQLQSFPIIAIKNIITESDHVVIESTGVAKTKEGKQYNQTYCDVFKFSEGKLQEITTYLDTALSNVTSKF